MLKPLAISIMRLLVFYPVDGFVLELSLVDVLCLLSLVLSYFGILVCNLMKCALIDSKKL